MSYARLLLIRHGLTRANRRRRWHGSTDTEMTRRGRRQAQSVASRLRSRDIEAIYSSPLKRCLDTAELIAGATEHPVQTVADLREWNLGAWEGESFADLDSRRDFFRLTSEDLHYAPPGGESVQEVAERVVATLRATASRHRGTVVVVGHGAALAVAAAALLDDDPTLWRNYSFANCSISELVLDPQPLLHKIIET